jgi:hypothetical protein
MQIRHPESVDNVASAPRPTSGAVLENIAVWGPQTEVGIVIQGLDRMQ